MRRKFGLGAIKNREIAEAKFKEKSNEISKDQIVKLTEQIEVFRNYLQDFATKHRKDIKKNGEFRRHFQEMCATVGVDPLQSSNNFWSKLLGVGDFYYELAVQIVEVCMATSHQNGGVIAINDLLRRVKASRNSSKQKFEEITLDDLLRSIDRLNVLGGGIKVIKSGKTYIIQSVAKELSMDHSAILQMAQENCGYVNKELIIRELHWNENRIQKVINDMIMEGLIWVDSQTDSGSPFFWFPGLC